MSWPWQNKVAPSLSLAPTIPVAALPVVAAATTPKIEAPQENHMAITFKSVGHFFAKAFTAIKTDLPKAAAVINKVDSTETTVEQVTAAIPGVGTMGVTVEKAAYAALGELSALLTAGGDAAAKNLTDAGLDINVITQVKSVLASLPTLTAVAKSL